MQLSTYEDAKGYIEFYFQLAKDAGFEPEVCLVPVDIVYELVGKFFEVGDGEYIGLDNEYVTKEVAMKLNIEADIPFKETFK